MLNQGTQSSCPPQPHSHDKSMVSPEEHREPSPEHTFFNYVDVNYAGRVVSYLASVALKKTKRRDYDSIYTRIVYISSLDNMACEGVAKDPRKSSNLRQNFRV